MEAGRRYPVVTLIYGGPQIDAVPRTSFNGLISSGNFAELLMYSALGFVAVMFEGRGTPGRSKAFHDFVDLERVGITGFSGGGCAAAGAMLRQADFYRVGIAGAGNYDQRMFWSTWGERYQGLVDGDNYALQTHVPFADRLRDRTGARRPLVVLGGALMPVSAWFLYAPMDTAGIGYFTTWFLCLYVAWSLFEIPHSAWGAEIATDYEDRARLFSFRAFANYVGGLAFFVIPLLPVFPSHEISFEVLRASVIAVSALLAAMLAMLWRLVPDGRPAPPRPAESLRGILTSVFANRPLLLLIAAYLTFGVGFGMWAGLLFLYIDAYLGLGQQVAIVFAVSTPVAVAGLPVWYRVIRRVGMARAWAISNVGIVGAMICTALLEPGQAAFLPLVAASLGVYFFASCQAAVAPAMLAGAADYGTWKFGVDRTATYYAVLTFATKIVTGVGAAAGLALAGAFGFDATANLQAPQAVFGLKLAFGWVPALVGLAALPLILAAPIDARRQAILRRRLTRRAAGSS